MWQAWHLVRAGSAMCRPVRIVVHAVGRTRERGWETLAASEYERRLLRGKPPVLVRTTFYSTGEALANAVEGLSSGIVLDRMGVQMNSMVFAEMLQSTASGHVAFIIGGAEGLPRLPALQRISLSQMTWPHRLARLLLLEQIFRSREIWAQFCLCGSPCGICPMQFLRGCDLLSAACKPKLKRPQPNGKRVACGRMEFTVYEEVQGGGGGVRSPGARSSPASASVHRGDPVPPSDLVRRMVAVCRVVAWISDDAAHRLSSCCCNALGLLLQLFWKVLKGSGRFQVVREVLLFWQF
eukprot:s4413_g1.t1